MSSDQKGVIHLVALFVIVVGLVGGVAYINTRGSSDPISLPSLKISLSDGVEEIQDSVISSPDPGLSSPAPSVGVTPSPTIAPDPAGTSSPSPTLSPPPSPVPTPSPTPTPSPSPSSSPSPDIVDNCSPPSRDTFVVKPYLVYPADKSMYPEYESSVRDYMDEMQQWYCDKVGATFSMKPLQVVRTAEDYQTVRCGPNPSQNCLDDPSKLESDMPFYVNKAVHGGVVGWEQQVSALAFVAGGGGWAGSVDDANYTSWAIVGDWVLEPISGVENTWGIPCQYSGGWQCAGGVPKGTPAHELGHTFGLDHPSAEGSIIKWHGDYPNVGFLSSEVEFLKDSPFFQ